MKTVQFKCKLLSDIVLSQNTATEGSQRTLDFIPGSVFLGLVASSIYKEVPSMLLFHSGKVQFGDAHPLVDNIKSYRIPASWLLEKGKKLSDGIYVHDQVLSKDIQLKQCRGGYVVFKEENTFMEVQPKKQFSIKSAYNSEKRRSRDQSMYEIGRAHV